MESYPRQDEGCPQLLDFIPKKREWLLKMKEETGRLPSEEKKLELRLGPPGEDWSSKDSSKNNSRGNDQSLLSFACFSDMNTSMTSNNNTLNNTTSGTKRGFTDTVNGSAQAQAQAQAPKFSFPGDHVFSASWSSPSSYQGKGQQQPQQTKPSFLQLQSTSQCLPAVMSKESSQHCCAKAVDLQSAEKKAFSPPSAANTAVRNSSAQKRTAPAPVVGWPPIRSFRKNLASSSTSKPTPESSNKVVTNEKPVERSQKGLFVKINMDGVPIGRKVDLKAFDSYEKLSSAVDELFRGLLAAQGDSSGGGMLSKGEGGEKLITGLLDGSGEYTLVYEDNEGDRMLVGDVPWHMFVSTVKRLRVLKSSEISTLCRGSKQGELSASLK